MCPGRSVLMHMTGATSVATGLPSHSHSWRGMSLSAKAFITLIVIAGLGTLIYGGIHQSSKNIAEFICYLGIAILASRLKVNLPGITGTLSVNFLFILIGVLELSFKLHRNADSGRGLDDGTVPVSGTSQGAAINVQRVRGFCFDGAGLRGLSPSSGQPAVGQPAGSAGSSGDSLLHRQRGFHRGSHIADGTPAPHPHSGGLLLLVVSLLPGGSGDRRRDCLAQRDF
ncbi:hypothetical protein SBA2_1200002 [Acidobacteriia bacterium SbA2]|nr:hypothetical protein SBA2_1200002 [Acidobacteriia bacterium SbA2]